MINDQNLPDHAVDRRGFVVAIAKVNEPWDSELKSKALIYKQLIGWSYHRTSPHVLTGLKPAEVAYHAQSGDAITSIYPDFNSLFPEYTHIDRCNTPLQAIKRVLEIA